MEPRDRTGRRRRALFAVTLVSAALSSMNPAHADAVRYEVNVASAAPIELRVRAGGTSVAAKLVTDLQVVVEGAGDPHPAVTETRYAAGENDCAAADDPAAGTMNRTVTVTGTPGGSARVYAEVRYKAKSAAGEPEASSLEPLGPSPGTAISSTDLVGPVTISVCMTD